MVDSPCEAEVQHLHMMKPEADARSQTISGALTRASSASWSVSFCLRLALGLDAAQVVVDLVVAAGGVPAELGGHQVGGGADRDGAAVEGLDRDPGTAGQDVVEVAGALVGDGVDDLGGEVVLGARQRLGRARDAPRPARAPRRPARRTARAGGRSGPRRARSGAPARPAGWSGSRSCRRRAAAPARCATARTSGQPARRAQVDGVARHDPVRRELAAGDQDQARHGAGHRVLAGDLGGGRPRLALTPDPTPRPALPVSSGRSPAYTPSTSSWSSGTRSSRLTWWSR